MSRVTSSGIEISKNVVTGTEYKLPYKLDGKDIYLKKFDFGAAPNNDDLFKSTGIPDNYNIIFLSIIGTASSTKVSINIPYITTNGNFIRGSIWILGDFYQLEICDNFDASVYTVCSYIFYTKN